MVFVLSTAHSAAPELDGSRVRALTSAELAEIRGGVEIDIALHDFKPSSLKTDNPQVVTDVISGNQNPQPVYYMHGGTKTKSKNVALSGGSGTASFRVPVRPSSYTTLDAAWYGDCDANPGTPDDFCFEDSSASTKLGSSLKYRAVRFHNTRSPASGSPVTSMLSWHGQRFVDDDSWTWSSSHINVDWIWSNSCAATSRTVFGLTPWTQNLAVNDNIVMPTEDIPWVNIPGLGWTDCTFVDNEIVPQGSGDGELEHRSV